MPLFEIKYSFDILDNQKEELSYWERGTFELEFSNKNDIDTAFIQKKIRDMARTHCQKTYETVSHANYYSIEALV